MNNLFLFSLKSIHILKKQDKNPMWFLYVVYANEYFA